MAIEAGNVGGVSDAPTDDLQASAERWHRPEPTGVVFVDDALAPLVELDGLPTGEHVTHYEAVHRKLQDALADLEDS